MRFDQVFGPGPADQPEDEPYHDLRQPEWFGPPNGELGASVALASVIGRSAAFVQNGGGGGQSSDDGVSLSADYWLWPLLEKGDLRVSCEWPSVGIPLRTVVLDAERLRVASANIIQLWPAG